MEPADFCRILGTIELLVGFPAAARPRETARWMLRLLKEETLMRLTGAFFLVLCVLVLSEGARPSADLEGLVRVAAWIGAVKSLAWAWWPAPFARFSERFLARTGGFYGPLALAAGGFFLWAGAVLSGA